MEITYSEYTHPGDWEHLYAELPDDLEGLIKVVKNLLIHPFDTKKHGIRVLPRRWRELRELFTVSRLLGDAFRQPPISLVAPRSPYTRVIEPCDFHAILFASFCEYKGYEVRTRCGFAHHIVTGRWLPHWLNEVRGPFFPAWRWVDSERQCFPKQADFRPGAAWWQAREVESIEKLSVYRYRGLAAVKHSLLNDFNALNRHELIHYRWLNPNDSAHGPAIYHTGYSKLKSEQKAFLEQVAQAITGSDEQGVRALFASSEYWGSASA